VMKAIWLPKERRPQGFLQEKIISLKINGLRLACFRMKSDQLQLRV
jgi:hypothetical protein